MKKKNFNGWISFRFNLDNSQENKIYYDLINLNSAVRSNKIVEFFLKYYYSDYKSIDELVENRLIEYNNNQKKLLSIIENLSKNNTSSNTNIQNGSSEYSNTGISIQKNTIDSIDVDLDNINIPSEKKNEISPDDIEKRMKKKYEESIR